MGNNAFEEGTTRPQLNIIYLLDSSGSMHGERINQLNVAMAEAVQLAKEAGLEKEAQVFIRIAEFNTFAKWIYGNEREGLENIDWIPLTASGSTNTAEAIDLARGVMHREYLGTRNYRPVVILITDGESNEPKRTKAAVEKLKNALKSSTGEKKDKITRIAIGVVDANVSELEDFASVGTIEHEDGSIDEAVPFVFTVDDINLLKGLIKSVTVSSIMSAVGEDSEKNGEEAPRITFEVGDEEADADDEGWEV